MFYCQAGSNKFPGLERERKKKSEIIYALKKYVCRASRTAGKLVVLRKARLFCNSSRLKAIDDEYSNDQSVQSIICFRLALRSSTEDMSQTNQQEGKKNSGRLVLVASYINKGFVREKHEKTCRRNFPIAFYFLYLHFSIYRSKTISCWKSKTDEKEMNFFQ